MECWSGALEWSAGVEYRSGLLEWPVAFACLVFLCGINNKNMYM